MYRLIERQGLHIEIAASTVRGSLLLACYNDGDLTTKVSAGCANDRHHRLTCLLLVLLAFSGPPFPVCHLETT